MPVAESAIVVPSLEELRFLGVVRSIDLHFARSMCRLVDESSVAIAAAAALVSAKLGEGHVCLDLGSVAGQRLEMQDDTLRQYPDLEAWRSAIQESALVSDGSEPSPLVLDSHDRLYLRRYWLHEQFLARAISGRAKPVRSDAEPGSIQASLVRLFGEGRLCDDQQRMAALMAARRQFSVVSGGPGTGKTFTVVKILALLVEQAFAEGSDPPRMMLMAPTGKAAARLVESIKLAKASLQCESEVKDAIVESASTIHRALGAFGKGTRYRYNEDNPLVTDLVLVDEASMVNVALMSRLLAAVPENARVILLGDRDQLASVEAGAVLADICNAGNTFFHSKELANEISELTGESISLPESAPDKTGIWDCVTHLSKSYRYAQGSGIEALALAIHAGDARGALGVLNDPEFSDVQLRAAEPRRGISEALLAQTRRGYGEFLKASNPGEAIAALTDFRILCAHHEGRASVEHINTELAQQLLVPEVLAGASPLNASEHYHLRPIIMGVNDYELRLFNGDIGVLMRTDRGLRAYFEGEGGTLRELSPSRLPPHQSVYAMSIHKSQGSEFDDIAVVMPAEVSPLLTRELIYTAVTRAKKTLTLYASEATLSHCIARRTERSSGLRPLLWGASPPSVETPPAVQAAPPEALIAPVQEAVATIETAPDTAASTDDHGQIERPTRVPVTLVKPRAERRRPKPAAIEAPLRQLAFNLDGIKADLKPAPPRRQRQALRRAALPSQTAACCGHKSAALLRCPRCAHVWVECCTC